MHHFRKAETLADKNTDSTALGWIYYGIGSAAFSAGRAAEALDACQRSLEMAARLHDDDLWMEAGEFFAGAMAWAGRIKEAFDHVDKVFECASRAGSAHHLMASAYVGASLSAALEDPKETRRRVDLGFNAKGIREAHFERRRLFQRLAWLNIMAGDLAEARRLMSEGLADSYYEGLIAFLEGDWEKAEAIQSKGLEESRIAGFGENVPQRLMELAAIRHARGDFGVAERLFLEGLRTAVESPNVVREFEIRLRLVVLLGEQRRTEDALLHLQRCRDLVALGIDWRGPSGRFETAEAVFAAAEARWTDANRHFAQAIEIFRRYELPWQIAENFTRWSRLLSSAGERIAAAEKVKRASEIYRSIAASASFVQRVLPRLAPTIESAGSESNSLQDQAVQSTAVAVLRPEGDYWTIAFNGASVRIKSSAGIEQIARMLREPGRAFDVRELADQSRATPHNSSAAAARGLAHDFSSNADLGDAGPVLDSRARDEYKTRLADLRQELDSAERNHDVGRVNVLRGEIEAIVRELSAAYGLGGRSRKASSHLERARTSVTKNIRKAIASIGERHPALARHLSSSIKTGYLCSYTPDPDRPVQWEL